jgi:broad specificity phosphatase PhoE
MSLTVERGLPAAASDNSTVVHFLRHGLVHNPEKILYGRLPDFHLSAAGQAMADRVAQTLADRPVRALVSSPLERALETVAPLVECFGLEPRTDDRLIEADSVFEGRNVSVGDGSVRDPHSWRHLINPFRPSWGEPYRAVAARMLGALADARTAAQADGGGGEAVCVSHQLPIVTLRRFLAGQHLWHDPRHRNCAVASITSLTFAGDDLVALHYAEPAADLVAKAAVVVADQPSSGA